MKRLSKIIGMFIFAIVMFSAVSAFAAVEYHTVTQNVLIRTDGGNTQYTMEEGTVTLRSKKDNTIAYADQFPINEDGGFSYKFKFKGDINDYNLYIRDTFGNPVVQNVTAVATDKILTITLGVELDNDGLFISDNEKARAKAIIANTYGDEREYSIILAMYDSQGVLSDCKISKPSEVKYEAEMYSDVFEAAVPKDTAMIKAFVLNGMNQLIPLADKVERKLSNYIDLPNIISDNMLIQANEPIKIWGKASYVGEDITAEIIDSDNRVITKGTSVVKQDGTFSFDIPAAAADRNCVLKIYTAQEEKVVNNVMIGELWLMGGQSNMELKVKTLTDSVKGQIVPDEEINDIRLFTVPLSEASVADSPQSDAPGKWVVANADTVNQFSAVGYVAIKELHDRLNVPVGGIDTSVGGSYMAEWVAENNRKNLKSGKRYNARIAPFTNLNIKGILWYQGENGEDRAALTINDYSSFTDKFDNLIGSWRNEWNKPVLPVAFVQLPVSDIDFSKVRLAQLESYQTIDNTAMAVIVDCIPNPTLYPTEEAIHFHDKIPVGKRLAYSVLNHFYDFDINDGAGPMFESAEFGDGKAILTFNNVGDGLATSDGNEPKYFAVAGSDGVYHVAEARVTSTNKVTVSSTDVTEPVSVRYLFEHDDGFYTTGNYPKANLVNSYGVPLSTCITK